MSDHLPSTPMEEISRNLFRVIRIVPDKQDYSFVEKVQLPEDGVIGLCNKLLPSSHASASSGVSINFTALDERSLPAVGFYGDKNTMIRIFRKESLVGHSVLAKMEGRQLEPGFYVSLSDEVSCAVVFYWHEDEELKKASRNNVSCNFIRYLIELCDSVYVCVQENYSFEALAASAASTCSKAKRIKRIQVSENGAELTPAYNVRIEGGEYIENYDVELSLPASKVQIANNCNGKVVFCEGYEHCCFLATEKRDPRSCTKTEVVPVKASEFCNMLQSWLSASNVDFSRLGSEQFVELLKNCQPKEFEIYTKFKEQLEARESAINTPQFQKFERCFLKAVPEFCPHVLRLVSGETKLESNSCSDANRLEELHRELSAILAGKEGKLLLLEADIKFISSQGEHVVTVQGLGQGNDITPFIAYGQQVHAKCSSKCGCLSKIDGKATFEQPANSTKDFPLSGETVTIVFSPLVNDKSSCKNEIEGEVHLDSTSYSAIRSWVGNMIPIELRSLEINIAFCAFLLATDERLAQTFIHNCLKTQKVLIQPPYFQVPFENFCTFHPNQFTDNLEALILSYDIVKTVCFQVYNDSKNKFHDNIKELWSRLFNKYGSLSAREEDGFVTQLKKEVSVSREGNLMTRFIEEVGVENQKSTSSWLPRWSSQADQQVELKVRLSIVDQNPHNVVYEVREVELTPMEKDLFEVNSNSGRPIVPTCGEPVELVTIDPQSERLYKIVLLKSRELVVFVHNFRDALLYMYRTSKNGGSIEKIHTFKRGFDLVAVDEATRSIALYEKEKSKILVYKIDESFSNVCCSGVEVNLESFNGSKIIVWMHFIPGKMELLLVDDTNRARVAEIHEMPMMKPKHISLPSPKHPFRACISADGDSFIVLRQLQPESEDIGEECTRKVSPINVLDIYVLGDRMRYLKTIPLNASISDFEQAVVKLMSFESKTLLLLYSPVDGTDIMFSHVLKFSLSKITDSKDKTEIDLSCPYLGYVFHSFEKFATSPKLFPDAMKRITFNVLLESSTSDSCHNSEACLKYSKALVKELKISKEKDFSNMDVRFQVNTVQNCAIQAAAGQQRKVKMGTWIRKLVCLVPVQIARVENNAMVALNNGVQIVPGVSLSSSICFGFYDAVLSTWQDRVKVISSIGKKSSGKSYLLNHLSGSLLDVSGGKCNCTDGVWMTIVTGEDGDCSRGGSCLYVLLDFEGLGSFERSEKEEMLLFALNAAVSNITIFNQKSFHLDKDAESAFRRFQMGLNLLKQEKKLFGSLLYIAIKDVEKSDVEDQIEEVCEKISQMCIESTENFKVEIAAMAPYNKSEYYKESLVDLAETVTDRIDFCYDNGLAFLSRLKLIIAQIALMASKKCTSIDSKPAASKIDTLRRNLQSAVQKGCLAVTNENEALWVLVNFDTGKEIRDLPVKVGNISLSIKDTGLALFPGKEILQEIRSKVEMVLPRDGRSGDEWHSSFESFLEALANRRRERVQLWISLNTMDCCNSDEVQYLTREANSALEEVKQGLSVCGCKCSDCFWRCVMEKGHGGDQHSCMGSHKCTENCSYCAPEGDILVPCKDVAGHEGAHDCKEKKHSRITEISSDSNEICSQRPGQSGQLKCSFPEQSCKNPCTMEIESTHKKQQCRRGSFEYEVVSEHYCDSRCKPCDYKWGDIEVPDLYFKKQGRGQIHLVPCQGFSNLYHGPRQKIVHKDEPEMTHEIFRKYVRFSDPCMEEERKGSEDHDTKSSLPAIEYLTGTEHTMKSKNDVPHHVIFVIDKSASMGSSDSTPTMVKFDTHKCRLGCVYEDILFFIRMRLKTVPGDSVSVVLFDESASVEIEMEDMKESVVDRLLQRKPGGESVYSSGLDAAEKILRKGALHPSVNVKKPVVIFLSDGVNNGKEDPLFCVDKMKRAEPRMVLHTIMFGTNSTTDILIEMAKKGGGGSGVKLDKTLLECGK